MNSIEMSSNWLVRRLLLWLASAVFILAFSTLGGAISSMAEGLGAAEASLAEMLFLILDMDSSSAASATLLVRFAPLWFGVAFGLIVWAISPDLPGKGANMDRSGAAGVPESRLP